jgi:hypothetical protein
MRGGLIQALCFFTLGGYMRKILFLLSIGAIILSTSDKSFACVCSSRPPSEGFDKAQAIFIGKVTKAKKSEWIVAVDRVWKGEVQETITLRDSMPGTSCAIGFKKGESYLFLVKFVKSERKIIYYPQVCNWGTRLKSTRLEIGENTYAWVEDLVLKDRGDGKPPIKKER